ncbi:SRPBCC family protein [Nocardia yamanashiensis]|uniref:SRPBCC family protein n=1 Tax=Nocardia yamanashiensis TaxID=209247 RepID=UPI001E46E26B|nr:SRPBCC family protein [Nocardia yamanashiensis]UGT43368.1 SRPBCC family protein [Nocardia yamanashiensis]
MAFAFASAVINAPAEEVWARLRDFGDLSWHPAIASCEIVSDTGKSEVGAVRRIMTAGGDLIVERLTAIDDDRRSFSYVFEEDPFGVRSYHATLSFTPVTADGTTFAHWETRFDADADAEARLVNTFGRDIFQAGLQALDKALSQS